MADQFQTSFIPKKAETRRKKSGGMGLFMFLAGLVFVLALAGSVGAFLYERFLEGSITRKEASLEQAREAFEPRLIQELARLDERIGTAQRLLADHRSLSPLFALLEELTLQRVRFTNFTYAATPTGHVITMSGEAASFASVALQADSFSKSALVQDPLFSNLAVNERGGVNFDFTATVDPSVLDYTPQGRMPELPETLEAFPDDTEGGTTTAPVESGETETVEGATETEPATGE